jgi:hypothetical protein
MIHFVVLSWSTMRLKPKWGVLVSSSETIHWWYWHFLLIVIGTVENMLGFLIETSMNLLDTIQQDIHRCCHNLWIYWIQYRICHEFKVSSDYVGGRNSKESVRWLCNLIIFLHFIFLICSSFESILCFVLLIHICFIHNWFCVIELKFY